MWLDSLLGRGSSSGEGRKWVAEGATLLDVRTPEEFASGHVEGAMNIPVQVLGGRVKDVPKGRVVVYCRSGGRSASAAALLKQAGFEVLDIGPMSAW